MAYRYIFDNAKPHKKFTCPGCKQLKVFVKYIDTITGEYLPEEYGKCDRESNCTYWLNPYKDGYSKRISGQKKNDSKVYARYKPSIHATADGVSYIHKGIFQQSLIDYENNHFITYLTGKLGKVVAEQLISRYFIGTSKHQFHSTEYPVYVSERGTTVFWKINIAGKITAGKVMLYNPGTGKRVKEPFSHVSSVHSILRLPEPRPLQCLFGEHLLKDNRMPVAIVESEKSAIIASAYLPAYIWLATGSLGMLTAQRCEVLKGRNVTLYPDINGFEKWSEKAKELSNITHFSVSDLLELNASETDRIQGLDLADYLIQFDYRTILKDLFKNEFLKADELLPAYQLQVWRDYQRRGLLPQDAKQVMTELINEYGFIITD